MAVEKLSVVVEEPEQVGEHLAAKKINLVNTQREMVVGAELHPDRGFFSAYWPTQVPEQELVRLAEECVAYYEAEGASVKVAQEPSEGASAAGENVDVYERGVILYTDHNGKGDRDEFPYQRPLTWQQIVDAAKGRSISYARIDTPIGDFAIMPKGAGYNFGVMSHILKSDGFETLLELSSGGAVGAEDARVFFAEVVKEFPVKSL